MEYSIKNYVEVCYVNDKFGNIRPMFVKIDDSVLKVDRLIGACSLESTKDGGCGMRYTVSIAGSQSYLYCVDDRWYF